MASEPSHHTEPTSPPSIDPRMAEADEKAIFTFLEPIKMVLNGVETDLHGIDMRALRTLDLALLDRFQGQPIALAENVVAVLCEIPVEQVRRLDLEDFAMLASDALFQVQQVSIALGLPADFFLHARPEEGEA